MKNLLQRPVATLAALVIGTVIAFGADVDGKWKAEFTSPDGTQRVNTFTFKSTGESLTGTVAGSQDETAIKDGKISGDALSFTAERPFGTMSYQGKISGDEIKMTVQFGDDKFDLVAKRVK